MLWVYVGIGVGALAALAYGGIRVVLWSFEEIAAAEERV